MNRYLAQSASLDEKGGYLSNPQNPQNSTKLGFEGFEGSLGDTIQRSPIPRSGLRRPADGAAIEEARRDRFEERAAILEFDEGLPRAEAEAVANRDIRETGWADDPDPYAFELAALRAKCPAYASDDRWRQAITDADEFLSKWRAQAQSLGWTAADLFGLHPAPQKPAARYQRLARYDSTGLIWLLQGRSVVALTADTAAIQVKSGGVLTYRKHNKPALGPLGDSLDDMGPAA